MPPLQDLYDGMMLDASFAEALQSAELVHQQARGPRPEARAPAGPRARALSGNSDRWRRMAVRSVVVVALVTAAAAAAAMVVAVAVAEPRTEAWPLPGILSPLIVLLCAS